MVEIEFALQCVVSCKAPGGCYTDIKSLATRKHMFVRRLWEKDFSPRILEAGIFHSPGVPSKMVSLTKDR